MKSGYLALAALGIALLPARDRVTLVEITPQTPMNVPIRCGDNSKLYIVDVNGNGCAWLDYNNDGLLDLYLTQGSTISSQQGKQKTGYHNYLFENRGGGRFEDVTFRAGVAGRPEGWAMGVVAGDYDGDGWTDLLVTYIGKNLLYRNRGDGTFADTTETADLSDIDTWHAGASFGDYDGDGDLDLYVTGYVDFDFNALPKTGCLYKGVAVMCGPQGLKGAPDTLYRNLGNGRFENVTRQAGLVDTELHFGFGAVFVDLDGDLDLDLYVANDSRPNFLYRNNGDGTFSEAGLESGAGYREDGSEQAGMGIAIGDYNRDGRPDIFVTNFSDDYNTLYTNQGELLFTDQTRLLGLAEVSMPYLSWATFFCDFDLDGWEDLFVANGHVYPEVNSPEVPGQFAQRDLLYENTGGKGFREIGLQSGLTTEKVSRGGAYADFDNDGDLDVFVVNMDDTPTFLENRSETGHNWVGVSLRQPYGAVVKLTTPSGTQFRFPHSGGSYLSQNDPRVVFGIGRDQTVSQVEVVWPNGTRKARDNLEINRYHLIE